MISDDLLKILACPECKTGVSLENGKIVCTQCGRKYPIRNNIPVMLVEEAESDEKK
ncbi:MAG: Trm112 family protein [Omnitrophica bacterium]|nr:Trm112 family protein [Candidatus Omnitrophota bacterium]